MKHSRQLCAGSKLPVALLWRRKCHIKTKCTEQGDHLERTAYMIALSLTSVVCSHAPQGRCHMDCESTASERQLYLRKDIFDGPS
eukprot:3889204-Amphidinium_carterae.1